MQRGGNTNFPGRRPKGLLCVTCGTLPALFGTLRYPKFTPYFPFFLFSPLCKVHFSYGIIPGEFWDQPGSVQSQRNHPAEISAMARGMAEPRALCHSLRNSQQLDLPQEMDLKDEFKPAPPRAWVVLIPT